MADMEQMKQDPAELETLNSGLVADTSANTGGVVQVRPPAGALPAAGAVFGGLPFLPSAAERARDQAEQQDIARAVTGDADLDTGQLLGGEPLQSQPAPASSAGVTVTKKDVLGVGLDAVKKYGGDAAGNQAFKRGTWAYGETGGNTAKGAASAKVGLLVNAAKIATAQPGAERDKAIADLAGDALGDATSAGGKVLAGGGKVGGEVIKAVAGVAFAKDKEARTEAVKDGGIGAAGEVAGAIGGNVAKAAASAAGGLIDVAAAPTALDRSLRAEKRFVETAGAVPIIGKPIAQKIIDHKRKALPFQGEVGRDEANFTVSGAGFGSGPFGAEGEIPTAEGEKVTTAAEIIDPETGRSR